MVDDRELGVVRWVHNKIAEQGGHSIYGGRLWLLRILDGMNSRQGRGESPEHGYRGASGVRTQRGKWDVHCDLLRHGNTLKYVAQLRGAANSGDGISADRVASGAVNSLVIRLSQHKSPRRA
jgi:hypothetical protein